MDYYNKASILKQIYFKDFNKAKIMQYVFKKWRSHVHDIQMYSLFSCPDYRFLNVLFDLINLGIIYFYYKIIFVWYNVQPLFNFRDIELTTKCGSVKQENGKNNTNEVSMQTKTNVVQNSSNSDAKYYNIQIKTTV